MKGKLIKELHAMGVWRDPRTKVKLESMKTVEIFAVKKLIESGELKPIPKDETPIVFITPERKADKLAVGSKRKGKK